MDTLITFCAGFFSFYSLPYLCRQGKLSQTSSWKWQKPILAAFGRSMTGITACLILGLLFTIEPISENAQTLLAFTLVVVYAWSARQALEHNVSN